MAGTVLYERKGNVGIIKFNRPQVLNAVNDELIEDLIDALNEAKDDAESRVLVIKGEGRAFCAGLDLKESVIERTMEQHRQHTIRIQEVGRIMATFDKPIIGAIRGYALGAGCELALNCDIRIAAVGTKFGFPETSVGATVTTAGTKLLPAVIGLGRAMELFFTSEFVDADKAAEWGLVNKVVPIKKLDEVTMEIAEKIASNYPLSLALTRASIYNGLSASLDDVFREEANAACVSFGSRERFTGMKKSKAD
jgi:enoyl-CoA hydratase